MLEEVKVFVAHSFEKTPPDGETMSDQAVAEWFIKLIRSKPVHHQVSTGAKPSPERIDEKIKAAIADSHCVIGIFTKRHYDEKAKKWLPSQFVICETACAVGFYYNTNRLICGFYEEGIDPGDLALITIGGLELMPFKRSDLEKDKQRFAEYLKKIPQAIASGYYKDGVFVQFKLPYPFTPFMLISSSCSIRRSDKYEHDGARTRAILQA